MPETAQDGPALTYYLACVGRWAAPLQLRVTDAAALRNSGMSLKERWSLHLLARWPRWLGAVSMQTTITVEPSGEVIHTTVVSWRGLPLQRSVETFTPEMDGISLSIRGGMTGYARATPGATRMEYELLWLGARIRQHTLRETDLVTVWMEGPGFVGEQRLVRQAPAPGQPR